jgi:hypothetical protein
MHTRTEYVRTHTDRICAHTQTEYVCAHFPPHPTPTSSNFPHVCSASRVRVSLRALTHPASACVRWAVGKCARSCATTTVCGLPRRAAALLSCRTHSGPRSRPAAAVAAANLLRCRARWRMPWVPCVRRLRSRVRWPAIGGGRGAGGGGGVRAIVPPPPPSSLRRPFWATFVCASMCQHRAALRCTVRVCGCL